jgi:hypothetical protein
MLNAGESGMSDRRLVTAVEMIEVQRKMSSNQVK